MNIGALSRFVFIVASISLFLSPSVFSAKNNALQCITVPQILDTYLNHHIHTNKLTNQTRSRTVENYLKSIDPSKTLFLDREINKMKYQLTGIFRSMVSGNCEILTEIQKKAIERGKENENFVKAYIGDSKYKLDESVELESDPDNRKYSRSKQARLELLKKFLHFQMSNYLDTGTELAEAKKKLIHKYELVTKRLEEKEATDLLSAFIGSFSSALDPHSGYFSPDDLEDFQIQMGLSLEGIGVSLSSRDGYITVEEILTGGAADALKTNRLRPKDKIIAVSQQEESKSTDVIDMDLRDVVRLIRGKKGSKVTLTVLRQTQKTERFNVTIVRDKVDLKEQAAKLTYEDIRQGDKNYHLAVIELPSFYGDRDPTKRSSYRDMKNLLRQIKKDGKADGLLLDLSKNGGGLLEDAVRISGLFVKTGGIVATQMSKNNPSVLKDTDDSILYSGPMIVLISRLTASASEILAGALQDYRRAIIVGGDHSFGKGTVQSVLSLPLGLGALKITTGMFFRPNGFSTQRLGVKSDVPLPSLFSIDEIGEKALDFALENRKISNFLSKEANQLKPELQWTPVSRDLVKKLRKSSTQRVAKNEKFKEIKEELKKAQKKNKIIKLSEVRDKKKSEKSKEDDESLAKNSKKEEDSPQYKEAIQILGEYVHAQKSKKVKITSN